MAEQIVRRQDIKEPLIVDNNRITVSIDNTLQITNGKLGAVAGSGDSHYFLETRSGGGIILAGEENEYGSASLAVKAGDLLNVKMHIGGVSVDPTIGNEVEMFIRVNNVVQPNSGILGITAPNSAKLSLNSTFTYRVQEDGFVAIELIVVSSENFEITDAQTWDGSLLQITRVYG